jgi:hypothetical protein
MSRPYQPRPGDEVRTTAIAPDLRSTTAHARIRRVYKKSFEVIYGVYGDRALVLRTSCKFVRRGTLSNVDKAKYPGCFG